MHAIDEDGFLDEEELEKRHLSLDDLAERIFSWSGLPAASDCDAVTKEFWRLRDVLADFARKPPDFIGLQIFF